MFKPKSSVLFLAFYILLVFQIVCKDSSFSSPNSDALENALENSNNVLLQEAKIATGTESEVKRPQAGQPLEKAATGTPKKSLKGNLKFKNPKELEVKLKYRREKFNAIVGFPLRIVMKVGSFVSSGIRGIFNLIRKCISWSFYATYWLVSKFVSLLYKVFLLNPYKFARYLYYQYGTLIFFCSLPVMFGIFGGIFFATLSEGTIQLLSLYLFPKDPE